MMRILFLQADCKEHPLDLAGEYKAIKNALLRSKYRDQFDLSFQPSVRVEELEECLLLDRPSIVHLACYSSEEGEEGMWIQDKNGKTKIKTSSFFSNLFSIVNPDKNIRCVVLNTCNCKKIAEAISKNVSCVIGQEALISDKGAIEFASKFYEALGSGRNVNNAFDLAASNLQSVQEAMTLSEKYKISRPVLKYAPGVDPSKVFLTNMPRSQIRRQII